jgi:cation diffusion facilitator family transporter
VVYSGLVISARPADSCHPYGHGKAESIAGLCVSLFLFAAACLIAFQSIGEIRSATNGAPAWYTLAALILVVVIKEGMFRFLWKAGDSLTSTALKGDAWHHRSDALTSLAAAIGISLALFGGEGFAGADDWAALLACAIIFYNAATLFKPALDEIMDASVPGHVRDEIRVLAEKVPGVVGVHKCRIRKSGTGLMMDIDIVVNGDITVRQGHAIAHAVHDHIRLSDSRVSDVKVHIEPPEEIGGCAISS